MNIYRTGDFSKAGRILLVLGFFVLLCLCFGCGPSHRVSYDGNGNESGAVPESGVFREGEAVPVPGNAGALARKGYLFAGWRLGADGKGPLYGEGQTLVVGDADVVLYAVWKMPPGTLDGSFDIGHWLSYNYASFINAVAVQDGGSILLGGEFPSSDGKVGKALARINPEGSLDGSLPWKAGFNQELECIALQGGGKIIVAGLLCWEDNVSRTLIARVNGDGTLDHTFKTSIVGDGCPSSMNFMVHSLAQQPDGKLVVGGKFQVRREDGLYDTSYTHLTRLLADGSLDKSFQAKAGPDGAVYSIVVDKKGKIIIGGSFNSYNGMPRHGIARLHGDGSLDKSFDPGKGPDQGNFIVSIVPVDDGKMVIGGTFVSFNGVARRKIARLNGDGSLDKSFNPGKGADNDVNAVVRLPDGKLLIGGGFLTYNGVTRNRLARLEPDGSLDLSFNPGLGPDDWVNHLDVYDDSKILVTGSFSHYNGKERKYIARIWY